MNAATDSGAAEPVAPASIPRPGLLKRLARHPLGIVGLIGVVLIVVLSLAAPLITPYDPAAIDVDAFLQPPSAKYLLGTDMIGHDMVSRLLEGGRVVVMVVALSIGSALAVGTAIGVTAGYYGGVLDAVLMRIVDALLALPVLILALVVIALLGPDVINTIVAIAVSKAPNFARMARGQVLVMRKLDFVDAARCIGCSNFGIIVQHIVPNIAGPLLVYATLQTAQALIAEASLSFLGLGVQPPQTSWGLMIAESMAHLSSWWLAIFPGLCIFAAVISLNLLGDALRDEFDIRGPDIDNGSQPK